MSDYDTPKIPPATPPTIDPNASPVEARELAMDNGDSDFPGNTPDEVNPGEGDTDRPDNAPDEIVPGKGDDAQPGQTPDEIVPDKGDTIEPDNLSEIQIERDQRDGLGEQGMDDTSPLITPPPPD